MDEPISPKVRAITLGSAAAVVAAMIFLRFCGDQTLPPKPPPPASERRAASEVIESSTRTVESWRLFLERDAQAAALPAVTPAEMARALPFRAETSRHVLAVGDAPLELAGLRLTLATEAAEPDPIATLTIENLSDATVAYRVSTDTSLGTQACSTRTILTHNAVVIGPGRTERRSECIYRQDMRVVVTGVETVALPALAAWYLSRVPPAALALDARTSRGHRAGMSPCSTTHAQDLRVAIDRGETTWRDLVDFYARHRCETYEFPSDYKYFQKDAERALPALPR